MNAVTVSLLGTCRGVAWYVSAALSLGGSGRVDDSSVGISSSVFSTLVSSSSLWSCSVGGLRLCSCLSVGTSWSGGGWGEDTGGASGTRSAWRISAETPLAVVLVLAGEELVWLFSAALSYAATDASIPCRSGVQTISPEPSSLVLFTGMGLWSGLDFMGVKEDPEKFLGTWLMTLPWKDTG